MSAAPAAEAATAEKGRGAANLPCHSTEARIWRDRCNTWAMEARRGMDVKQSLEAIRKPGMKWS